MVAVAKVLIWFCYAGYAYVAIMIVVFIISTLRRPDRGAPSSQSTTGSVIGKRKP